MIAPLRDIRASTASAAHPAGMASASTKNGRYRCSLTMGATPARLWPGSRPASRHSTAGTATSSASAPRSMPGGRVRSIQATPISPIGSTTPIATSACEAVTLGSG
jgi:hypothetical protein